MKIAILGDAHFGMRSDSIAFHNLYERFYRDVFFPYLEFNQIEEIIQMGDLFDRRKFVNYNTLALCKGYFFDRLFPKYRMRAVVGNHDIYYRNTLEVNALDLLLGSYKEQGSVECISTPRTIEYDGIPLDFIPWVCRDNEREIKDFILNSRSQVCFGHFEIQGFEMERGHICLEGMTRNDLDRYDMAISGHFHHKSSDGHIYYVGSPGEMTWADYDDDRGFHIFDTNTRELEFIPNPHRIHHKLSYDDSNETLESIQAKDLSPYENTIVKVIVQNKNNSYLFDTFIDQLYSANPLDISIVEDFSDNNVSEEDLIDQADDTNTLISKYVDGIETGLDKDRLKNVMREIFIDAQNFESVRDLND